MSNNCNDVFTFNRAGNRRSHWETERVPYERQDVELQG